MSGAAVWANGFLIGVVKASYPSEGPTVLTVARIDRFFDRMPPDIYARLREELPLPELPQHLRDVIPIAPGLARTAYWLQVKQIVPDKLIGREDEYADLVRLCAGDQPYSWWQAGPWAGKTALMATFTMNSPPGVDVVSFFITNRFAGQSDSDSFLDAMLEQLPALLGESPKANQAARHDIDSFSHCLKQLPRAAEWTSPVCCCGWSGRGYKFYGQATQHCGNSACALSGQCTLHHRQSAVSAIT